MFKVLVVLFLLSFGLSGCLRTTQVVEILEDVAVSDAVKAERMRRAVGPRVIGSGSLKALVGDKKVRVGEFTSFDPGRKTYMCRLAALISPPGDLSYEQYLRDVFVRRLAAEGVYDESSLVVLTGHVESMEYSSRSDYWSIGLKIVSSGGGSVSVFDKYQYEVSFWGGGSSCVAAKKEMPFAVNRVIGKLVSDPAFPALFGAAK